MSKRSIGAYKELFREIDVSLGTVNEVKLTSNALDQVISVAAKFLDFFLLADTHALLLGQLFGSLGVDPSAHPVDHLDQLCSRRRTPVYGLNVVSDYAGQVVAIEDN